MASECEGLKALLCIIMHVKDHLTVAFGFCVSSNIFRATLKCLTSFFFLLYRYESSKWYVTGRQAKELSWVSINPGLLAGFFCHPFVTGKTGKQLCIKF